jgi:uncharacterized protein DUF3667
VTETLPWTCPTCHTGVATPFCPDCGEHPLQTRELTLRGLVEQVFEAFTNIDSKLVRSFRNLLMHPGFLTVAYLQGRRKAFLGPVPLFLIANVVFFAVESLIGSQVFTTHLDSHLHTQPWSEIAPQLVQRRLAALHTTLELYAPAFDQAMALKARSLIIFMALFFALVPMLVFLRSRRPLVAHAVFALHFYAFLLLPLCVAAFIQAVDGWVGGFGFTYDSLDHFLSISLLVVSAVYLYFAIGAVYGSRGIARIAATLVLTVFVGAIVLAYRFALLLITLYSTGTTPGSS